MNYFFDTEFYERGHQYPIQLISIGVVSEDGREFYAECDDVDYSKLSPWLQENVVPHLTGPKMSRDKVASGILNLVAKDPRTPRFWGYYAAYDWVLFCQLFGTMINMSEVTVLPKFCQDVKQLMEEMGVGRVPVGHLELGPAHNALSDAKWTKAAYDYLRNTRRP